MQAEEIVQKLRNKELYLHGSVLLTKEQHDRYIEAHNKYEYFDMLQGVRKVLL
jgi:hypothetical protein